MIGISAQQIPANKSRADDWCLADQRNRVTTGSDAKIHLTAGGASKLTTI
jgi:hypothetical protein